MPDARERIAVALDASERGRILELARLDKVFSIDADVAAALAARP